MSSGNAGYLIGIDLGSSSVKVSILDPETGNVAGQATAPQSEMEIQSPQPGWAEQDPNLWWENMKAALGQALIQVPQAKENINAIGIAYQMHGLVLIDSSGEVVRPAIIWCDSRAVPLGERAFHQIGKEQCLKTVLNSPGNFTAAKLRWVMSNESKLFSRVSKFMLPGDYLAFRMSGEAATTVSGLSEGIFWDFEAQKVSSDVLSEFEIDSALIPRIVPTFGIQAELSNAAAAELGLPAGTPIAYRAGDQPNNAFSLKVLEAGEVAATAGTSGVVYGVTADRKADARSRVNAFAHVNHTDREPRLGILLCLNGTAILNSWLHRHVCPDLSYKQMDDLALQSPVGANGLSILPFGNGAERILENRNLGSTFRNIDFNRHGRADLLRAAQEGIVFGLEYGLSIMRELGVRSKIVRAGRANMFLSPLFREAFCTVSGATLELFDTDGSQGAARGAGVGSGLYSDPAQALSSLKRLDTIEPNSQKTEQYQQAFGRWSEVLESQIG